MPVNGGQNLMGPVEVRLEKIKTGLLTLSHQALWSVRISVSTLAFQAGKRGSTPLRSTKFARMN